MVHVWLHAPTPHPFQNAVGDLGVAQPHEALQEDSDSAALRSAQEECCSESTRSAHGAAAAAGKRCTQGTSVPPRRT